MATPSAGTLSAQPGPARVNQESNFVWTCNKLKSPASWGGRQCVNLTSSFAKGTRLPGKCVVSAKRVCLATLGLIVLVLGAIPYALGLAGSKTVAPTTESAKPILVTTQLTVLGDAQYGNAYFLYVPDHKKRGYEVIYQLDNVTDFEWTTTAESIKDATARIMHGPYDLLTKAPKAETTVTEIHFCSGVKLSGEAITIRV